MTKDQITAALSAHSPLALPLFDRRESAVLVPLVEQDGELHVLMTRRAPTLAHHAGEISFPGGAVEPDDASSYAAALREAREEIGLDPESCEALGALDDGVTVTGYRMTPHVVFTSHPAPGGLDPKEVQQLLSIPLAVFLARRGDYEIHVEHGGVRHQFPLYVHQGDIIWGATARIMAAFVRTLKGGGDPDSLQARLTAVIRRLLASRRIILSTHVNPDPDGMGAQIALEEFLLSLGKEVIIANNHPIPDRYSFMEFRSPTLFGDDIEPDLADGADLLLVVDTGERERIGRAGCLVDPMVDDIAVLDHHLAGDLRGDLTVIDSSFSSTCELVHLLLARAGFPLTKTAVNALYAGIMFDTGGFRFINDRSSPFKVAAQLVDSGAEATMIQEKLFASVSPRQVGVLNLALNHAEYEFNGRFAWSYVTRDELRRISGAQEDAGEISSFFVSIETVQIALFMRELDDGRFKLSFRSKDKAPIGSVCRLLGGGGHANAGGATVRGSVYGIVEKIRSEIERILTEAEA